MAKDEFSPFEDSERWDVSLTRDRMLTDGDWVCVVETAEEGTSSKGNPQIVLRFVEVNEQGAIRAWETYHEEFLRRIASLYDAAQKQVPQPGEFDVKDHCRISPQAVARLVGARVGIVVRSKVESDQFGEDKKRTRVEGYVLPERINAADDDDLGTQYGDDFASAAVSPEDPGF